MSVKNVYAVANITASTSFVSADAARANASMDAAGTWNGSADVTNSTGDTFTLSIENTAGGAAVDDSAFDIDLSANVPAGFRLPTSPMAVSVTDSPGTCSNINGVTATQPGGAGNPVNFNIANNTNIAPGCTYNFILGLTTDDSAPFAASGLQSVGFAFTYNSINNVGGSQVNVPATQNIQVNPGNIALTKTSLTPIAANGQLVDFRVDLLSADTGGVFDVVFTDTLSANLNNLSFISLAAFDNTTNNPVAIPPNTPGPLSNQITFSYIPSNVRIEIGVRSTATVNPTDTNCPDMTNDGTAVERTGISASDFATVDFNLANSLQLTHDLVNSFCELCGVGTVRLTAQNAGGISLVNINLTEDLLASGLTYVAGSTQISIDGAAPIPAGNPIVSGANNQILNWTPAQIPQLGQLDSPFAVPAPPNPISIEFIFQVERAPGFNEEGLNFAVRNIQPSATYDLICGGISQNTTGALVELPIRQPVPQVVKQGRNIDAAQGAGAYADIVYGHIEDSVIWRVEVQNTGQADLEDLLIDDTIGGNFDINWICNSEATATTAAAATGGPAPAGCVSAGGGVRTSVLNFAVDDPFGNPGNDENGAFVDVTAAASGFIYYVGRIRASCTNQTNNADIEWGCEADSPPEGGLVTPATSGGVTPGFSIASFADLSAQVVTGGLDIAQAVTGVNVAQPVGSSGLVTITVTNLTGATVRNLDLTDTLPAEYVIDPTFVPTAVVTPFYGNNYLGMIDTINWDNEDVGNPLNNVAPHFVLTSSTSRPETTIAGDDVNLLRHGDVLTIQFRIVVIDPLRYDRVADLDVTTENQGDLTDPDSDFTVNNNVHINFDNICGQTGLTVPDSNQNFPVDIEDLDVSTSDALFILTNDPGTPLDLNTLVTNNGGHDADNYTVYITFGQAMTVQTAPAGCAVTTNPPPHPHWNQPTPIPATAAVYACNRPPIAPGVTDTITFSVIKAASPAVDDDLTFRADVIGEVTLSDGTPLTFPAPASIANTTPNLQLANNYTLDAVRARVMGFNLTKSAWYCTESGAVEPAPSVPPPATPAELNIQIGEDCNYFIESGGWFGFLTPGFTLIAVENVAVTDDLPDGQGFIPFGGTPYNFTNTTNISLTGANGGAGTTPLVETDITWNFNATGSGIVIKDEFFRVDFKTRLLNDIVDRDYAVAGVGPNLHSNLSLNTARTSFDAIFNSTNGDVTINVNDGAGIPGYPIPAVRQVTLTEIEPNIIVTKEVCNESRNGVGIGCSRFVPVINATDALDAGDSDNNYIYRVTLRNEAASGGVTRAPAFNVSITDVLDSSDLMLIAPGGAAPFDNDGLDNDGDGFIDTPAFGGNDIDGEFFSLTENVANGGTAATFVISHQHSNALDRIDPDDGLGGNDVVFYYRIDPDQAVAPLEVLDNTVTTTYDSLDGDFGNQNTPQLTNAENTAPNNSGRARIYTAVDAASSIQMLPLQTQRKAIIQVSNSVPGGPPQEVVVGEEIKYELHTLIPISNLRNFVIRDELPPGIRCMDTPVLQLNSNNSSGTGRNYAAAGFDPGGNITPTCTSTGTNDVVEWDLGNQELTTGTPGALFDFEIDFTARVENTDQVQEACNIRNGGSTGNAAVPAPAACSTDPTLARATYTNEVGDTITLNYESVDVVVREPVIAVTKSFLPVTDADADDILDVIVTATNNGSATAYNLQVLDDLTGANMTFLNVVGGTDPPDNIDVLTLGANQPIFSWNSVNPDFAIAPAEVKTFTFRVQVDDIVQPHEILDNTIEARWTSLPDVNTALPQIASPFTPRTLAIDGDEEGMRNGQLTGVGVASANPPNDYNDTATASVVVPELSIVKDELNPTIVPPALPVTPEIGAQKQFRITVSLPEGVTNNLTVVDDLAAAAESYFIENNVDFDITYTFNDIFSINGTDITAMAPADVEALFISFPADNGSGSTDATWNIGVVDTLSENDAATTAVNPQIIITYFARINNDTDTDAGDTLQNAATLNYSNGEDATVEIRTDDTPLITVTEPLLTLTKVVSNVTQPGLDPDGGDVLEYVITIDNTGDATAYDTNIVDTIPAGVTLVPAVTFTPTATINAGAVAGFISDPSGAPNGPLIWGRGNLDENLDIPAVGRLILTYRVTVDDAVEPLQSLDNSVVIDWTSLNGSSAQIDARERTGGADCSAIVLPNDYCAGPVVATQTVSNLNNITKTYNSDTFTPFNDSQLRIGDQVQYTLTLNFQEGTTPNTSIVDTIPNGMEFVGVVSVNANVGPAPFTNVAPFTHAPIATPVVTTGVGANTITWTLGDVVNVADNNPANNNFVIVYTAQVVNDELPIPQNTSTALLNSVDFNFDDVNNAPVTQIDSETITALEPQILLSDISKVRRNGILSGSPVTAGPSADAGGLGDIMDFELRACNSGLAPAYDLIIEDVLSTQMNETTIRAPGGALPSVTDPLVILNGVAATAGVEYVYTPPAGPAGTMRFTFNDAGNPLLPGQCAVVQLNIDNNVVGVNQSWDNSFQVVEYHSLDNSAPDADVNAAERETYNTLIGPVLFNMNTVAPIYPPTKTLVSPLAPAEATIGELVTYQVLVPNNVMTGTLFDLALTDTMSTSLTYVSSSVDTSAANAYNGTISDTGSINNQVNIVLDNDLLGGEQATINIVARVTNNASTNNATAAFGNTVNYSFAATSGGSPIIGGGDATDPLNDISIIEPDLVLQSKTVANITQPGNPPDAGDILRYTLTINASGGALFSDAFDVSIIDTLSLGLVYSGNSTISAGVGTISNPGTVGDGVSATQVMTWDLTNGSNIDIPEGTAGVTITYDVLVLDTVLANQDLTNSAVIQWTSLNGVDANERDGSGGINDYVNGPQTTTVTTTDNNSVSKTRLSDTSPALNAANDVRIGDIVDYQISLSLQEGTSNSVVLSDVLPQGLQYEGIVSINADTASPYVNVAPFTHTDILTASAVVVGDPLTGPSTVTWTLGDITNAGANDGNNDFVIIYRARVLDLVQTPLNNPASNIALQNNINFDYVIATGAAPTETDNETITIQQPNLTVAKTVLTQFGDLILVAGEQITYTVDIINNGQSPAYDVRLEDVIPAGIREGGITVLSTEVPIGNAVANLAPVYTPATGTAVWDFDTGVLDAYTIPAGQTLRLQYQVLADVGIGAGLSNLINTANVTVYHSFDNQAVPLVGGVTGVREIYGPTNTASAPGLSTPAPSPLNKANPANLNTSIGIPFTYRITVPDTPQATALYDVRILDNLDNLAPNVDLIFVDVQKVSVPGTWVPVNTGTPTNLVIEDAVNGIDILPGEQAVIDLTVVLRNSSNNVDGDTFINQASYTYQSVDGSVAPPNIGGPDSDIALTVVEPLAMTLEKTGPAVMTFGVPGTFTMNVQNIGSGPAYDLSISDVLPNPVAGGMCDTPPNNFSARVFQADGVTPVSIPLIENTHFTTTFVGAPTCTVTITMTDAAAEILPLNRLIVNYDATLDLDNINNATLDNVAATTQWFSGDTPAGVVVGEIRQYNEVISGATPGTPGTLDHEDIFTTTVASPELVIVKNVFNPVTGAPAFTAEPGEDVRYEITITNIGPVAATNFSLTDEPDRLNGAGFFNPGSMANINVSQGGADTSNTNINAGANAAGILDVRNLTLTDLTGGDNSLTIDFEMTLQSVIDSGTLVTNQAEVALVGFSALPSDDPNLPGATDPTQTIIGSIPTFRLLKTSQDVSGSVTVLQAGDILRYTITAQNIGAENAINTLLRDQVPANTTYVANTTTLNGLAIADPAAGISPLQNGILINAPEDLTPGAMRANSTATGNIATINFDVQINENVVNSTVISNQAYVGGDGVGSGAFSEQASDDPNTDIIGDPTRDVVGNVAIIDMQNTVELVVDNGTAGQVDPNDTLRYTITISNSGTVAANNVQLFDNVDLSLGIPALVGGVPADTNYVANSTFLNSVLLADVGVSSPLVSPTGVDISSADLPPPVQGAGVGTISPGQSAVLVYDVVVDGATPLGTVVINQLEVISAEFPDEFSDEDGNDTNGDQPTEIIVGNTQQLSISKDVFVVGGGTAQPGAILEYFIHVENNGASSIDLSNISAEVLKIFDDIDQTNLLTYVAGSARLNGVADPNIVFNSPRLIVNYDTMKRALSPTFMFEPGDRFTVRYLAQIDATAQQGLTISNTVAVDWGAQQIPADNSTAISCSGVTQNVDACSTVDLAVGGAPGVATLSGSLWHDSNLDELQDTNERVLAGWEIEIYFGAGSINPGDYLDSVFSDVNGNYSIQGLVPNDGDTLKYALRFRPPGANANTASLGTTISPFFSGNGPQTLTFFEVEQSSHTPLISLPIQPNGVAYDSVLRTPVTGAVMQLVNNAGTVLPASCFVDPIQQNQQTAGDGYYKFELNFSQAECVAGDDYTINVFPPAGYFDTDSDPATPNISAIIPPAASLADPGFDAVSCANDPLPTIECEVQTSEFAPPISIAPRTTGTDYYQKFVFNNGPGDEQIFNNHIALDPELDSAISITKTSALVNVTRGQLVPYTITLSNTLAAPLYDVDVVDLFPFGFKYINGSGRIQKDNGDYVKVEPVYAQGAVDENNVNRVPESTINDEIDVSQIVGIETTQDYSNEARMLTWGNIGTIDANSTVNIKLLLVVGSGVGEGEYVNRAVARNNQTTGASSLVAQATVRVVPDPTFDCSDVIGKVFDDKNLNAHQDEGEEGIPNVRVLTAKGLEITGDAHGRFHLTCAVVPNPDRGSNFIIKLDERSLPSGYRLTTENPRVVRATRGKMVKFNFGAAIHRVVRLDMADAVFEENTTEMRPQWLPRLDLLITELAKDPSLLRLSYLAENESESEVNDRLDAVKEEIENRWRELNCCYQLMIETEVFWRKGGPTGGEFDE
ncbi:MAG: hypothetical protein OQK98_06585 [Gammaproteobacteria bacterium]|nr:hypothetical protein [Gammaproteobacteria bacterium]